MMRGDMLDDRTMLRRQFENAANRARFGGKFAAGSCFDVLAGSVDGVSAELLRGYLEIFQDIEDGKIDASLMESIHRGWWSPASATEYLQRLVAFASGTQSFQYERR